jgi:Tfp pilus assembly protein PilF
MFSWMLSAMLAVSTPAAEPVESIVPPEQVMVLPPELRARVQTEVLAGSPSQRIRLDRLLHLMFDKGGLELVYQDDATLTVSQAYSKRTMNCLTFTMMFVALAREAHLDVHPQEYRDTLGWHQDSGIFYRVGHIDSVVRISGSLLLVDIARDIVITLHAPQPVSDQRLLAHYYNNLAMDDLEKGHIATAMREMGTALQLDPDYATNWSNAGVLYLHNGDTAAATNAYTRALTLEPDNASALANMANLAQAQGDTQRAAQLRDHLQREQQSDPFYHFIAATNYEQAEDYPHAIEEFERAIHFGDGEPRFYAALSHAYQLEGDTAHAIHALGRAALISTGRERDDYRKQIDELRGRPGSETVEQQRSGQ